MPLLNKLDVPPPRRVLPPGGPAEVFVLRVTGEVVATYEEYTAKRNQYAAKQWADRYGVAGGSLTYEEALRVEEGVESKISAAFSAPLEAVVVRQIHHSTLRKDELVARIHEHLRGGGAGDSDKENGGGATADDSGAPDAANKPAAGGAAAPVSKRLLTQFLVYVADKMKPGVWVVKEPWVTKHSLSKQLPPGLQPPPAASGGDATPGAAGPGTLKSNTALDATPLKSPKDGKAAAGAPPRTLEEEESRLRPGSVKCIAFAVMKARGADAPASVDDVIRISTTDGSRVDWDEKSKRTLSHVRTLRNTSAIVLASDATFVRVSRGVYTLRALAPHLVDASPHSSKKAVAAEAGVAASSRADVTTTDARAAVAAALPLPPTDADAAEVSALARAEAAVTQARRNAALRSADLTAAREVLDACTRRLDEAKAAAKAAATAQQPGEGDNAETAAAMAAELNAKFALPKHLAEYSGAEDDRKAKSAWRQERAKEEKRLAAARAAHVQALKLANAKSARAGIDTLAAAAERAKRAVEDAAAKHARAVKAEADASRAVEREKQREMLRDIKEQARLDKDKAKQAEKEERERRRLEALAARRYPVEDLELVAEQLAAAAGGGMSTAMRDSTALDVAVLTDARALHGPEAVELGAVLYVSDTLSQFARQLSVRSCSAAELRSVLAAAATPVSGEGSGNNNDDNDGSEAAPADARRRREALQWLAGTYQQLLKIIVRDVEEVDGSARVFARWAAALDDNAGVWPELLRRWVLLQHQDKLASDEAIAAAWQLQTQEASSLSASQHLVLLTQLLDDCLDSNLLRDVLSSRLETAAEVAAGVRADLAEGRKKLRELADAEKESRKLKRAAMLALATAAAERQLREQPAGTGDNGVAPTAPAAEAAEACGGSGAGAGTVDGAAKKARIAASKEILERVAGAGINSITLAELEAELDGVAEQEPTWELPPELQEYGGPPGDKKLMSEFRRKQQDARKALEKDRVKWAAGRAARERERAERRRAEVDKERKLAGERRRAEEALAEQQERLEQQLERHLVRRQPLGMDRFSRAYWWGLAGDKGCLLVQGQENITDTVLPLLREAPQQQQQQQGLLLPHGPENWSVIEDAALVERLAGCLEQRGIRERDLRTALDKVLPSISAGISKAAAARAAAEAASAAADGSAAGPKSTKGIKAKQRDQEFVVPREMPSRHARSAAAEQIRKTGTAAAARGKEESSIAAAAAATSEVALGEDEAGPMRGWQLAAAKGAISSTLSLCESAAAAGLSCPGPAPGGTTSWRTYSAQLEGLLARGEVPAAWTAWADADAAAAAAAAAATVTAAGGRDGMASHGGEVSAPDMHRARASHAATGATRNQGAEAVLAHLRLQLLLLEEVFSGATGEMRYIDRGTADGASPGDEDEEGQGDCMEEGSALAASDAPEAAGNRGGRRGSKRPGPGADGAREGADGADSADGPVAKRGRSAGATGMGLPPRPEARMHADRSGSAAVPGPKAVPNSGSPAGSREGSAAPPPLGAAQRKRGRGESVIATLAPVTGSAGTSRASSAEPCCEESTVPHVPRGRKQARNAKASAPGGASVAPDMSAAAGSVAPESDTDAKDQGRRRSAPSAALRRTGDASGGQEPHHQGDGAAADDPEEVVAEEDETCLPAKLAGATLWQLRDERESWRAATAAAGTAAGVAYCASALAWHAAGPLQKLASVAAAAKRKRK